MQPADDRPWIGRIVHYVSYGTPGGEYTSQCRAAIIAGLDDRNDDPRSVDLVVLNPTGMFFNQRCVQDEPQDVGAGVREVRGGTWHWPEKL